MAFCSFLSGQFMAACVFGTLIDISGYLNTNRVIKELETIN